MQKICFVTTTSFIARPFLLGHIRALSRHYRVHLLMNTRDAYSQALGDFPAELSHLPLGRGWSLGSALLSLVVLLRAFLRERYSVVQSLAPLSGLIAMLAAWLTRRPVRIHVFTGQPWIIRRGPVRGLLKCSDRVIALLATHILTDSASQKNMLIDEGVVRPDKIRVLGAGSVCGVDVTRFAPSAAARRNVRSELEIAETAVVFLFVGRLNQEKGLLELAPAFAQIAADYPQAALLIVGPDEGGVLAAMRARCGEHAARLRHVGYTQQPERYMAAADVLCLPSHREGFGNVVIEGAACGLPALASRIIGITDAVVEGETGVLHTVGDVADIARGLRRYLEQPAERLRMGHAARLRAGREFAAERIEAALVAYYAELLSPAAAEA